MYTMSNKNEKGGRKRPYQMKARARRRDQVHSRITLAAVELHESVGPAKTTMEAIATLAGVRRATVYNHFPTEFELIDACSSHWFSEHPPPDPTPWLEIEDPNRRVETALVQTYRYFESGEGMLAKVLRDAPLVPALEEISRQKWLPMLERMTDVLAAGWPVKAASSRMTGIRASLRVALDFSTWQILIATGMTTEKAAQLAASWVRVGAPGPRAGNGP